MNKWCAAMAVAAAALPGAALADPMSYAFVQLNGILDAEVEPEGITSADGDGLGIEAGWIFGPYVFTDLRFNDYDMGATEGEETSIRLGVRSRMNTSWPRLDLYGMISYEDIKFDTIVRSFGSGVLFPLELIDDNGVGLHAGARFSPINWFELLGEVAYIDVGKVDGEFLTAGVQVNTASWFALNLRYRTGEYSGTGRDLELDSLIFGVRVQWGGG